MYIEKRPVWQVMQELGRVAVSLREDALLRWAQTSILERPDQANYHGVYSGLEYWVSTARSTATIRFYPRALLRSTTPLREDKLDNDSSDAPKCPLDHVSLKRQYANDFV